MITKIVIFLYEVIGENFCDTESGNDFLDMIPKLQATNKIETVSSVQSLSRVQLFATP